MAIAFDAVSDGGLTGGTTLSWTHTCTGSDRILFVGVTRDRMTAGLTVTYDGVSMTLVDKLEPGDPPTGMDRYAYLFVLVAPAAGANTVLVTSAVGAIFLAGAVSYTGARQTSQPSASNTNLSAGAATSLASSLTTVDDESWVVLFEAANNGGNGPDAGTGATERIAPDGFGLWGLFDSGGAVSPAGSHSMTTTRTSSSTASIGHILAAISPPGGGGGGGDHPISKRWGGVPHMGTTKLRGGVTGGVW